jgi:hypothetical protein
MARRRTSLRWVVASGCVALVALGLPTRATAGTFELANCQADPVEYNTTAFDGFAHVGMKIRRACDPRGTGLRGLITSNVVRDRAIPRGSISMVTMTAPAGTQFTAFRWAGSVFRSDCRYALRVWATVPGPRMVPIVELPANRVCPGKGLRQSIPFALKTYDVAGATQIVQRTVCVASKRHPWCSARRTNYVRTYQATAVVDDGVAPTVSIWPGSDLASGKWVSGVQGLDYETSDNVGVRSVTAIAATMDQLACRQAPGTETYFSWTPCWQHHGILRVDTRGLGDGSQPFMMSAYDVASNRGDSPPVTARVDNTPPGRVDLSVEGGDAWRNTNDFAVTWTNPLEVDRAPIAGVTYKVCHSGGTDCTTAKHDGPELSRIALSVPKSGEWSISLWRRDAAANETQAAESVPVPLRYDAEAPQLQFEPPSAGDPTLVNAGAKDDVSGVAGGSIEISPAGSGNWQTLPTQLDGTRLIARIDDSALPAGAYMLRAHARDRAENEASIDRLPDGQPMTVTLPLRVVTAMQAGFESVRTITETRRRHGKRERFEHRETVLAPKMQVVAGGVAQVVGRLTTADGHGLVGQQIIVFSRSPVAPEQQVDVLRTDSEGKYRYAAPGSSNRTVRFAFAGSSLVLPTQATVTMTVPAVTSVTVNRRRLRNGQTVTFTGSLQTVPAPSGGKLIELQALLPRGWQTFRTLRTDSVGRWAAKYHFTRTTGIQRYRFRVRLPEEAGYPFAAGHSRTLTVRVRGR